MKRYLPFLFFLIPAVYGSRLDNHHSCNSFLKLIPVSEVTGLKFYKGDTFQLPDGNSYTVIQRMEAGEDRRVYKVQRMSDGKQFAFKHARTHQIPKGKEGIQKELTTIEALSGLGIRQAKLEAFGKDWLLREWVDGELGIVWFKRWRDLGYPEEDTVWQKFVALLKDTVNKGVAISALDLDDIVYKDQEWFVIDSGRVRELPRSEAWKFYRADLVYSWCDKLGYSDFRSLLKERLRSLSLS